MPISLSKIANNEASTSFQYGEDKISLKYYPGRVTEKLFAQMLAFSSMDESSILTQFADFNAMLCRLIKSWDVYEDDEQTVMFPLDPERLAELPFAFRIGCISAITGDMRPN